jgi:hypothetical protein
MRRFMVHLVTEVEFEGSVAKTIAEDGRTGDKLDPITAR